MSLLCRACLWFALLPVLGACTATGGSALSAHAQVMATERAFAATLANRDFQAFAAFIDAEAIFIENPEPLRGKTRVLEGWKAYFDGEQAPFSWDPDQVEVLASGTLAHSSGLVFNAGGEPIARFNSIWRLRSPGSWKIVFDKGSPLE